MLYRIYKVKQDIKYDCKNKQKGMTEKLNYWLKGILDIKKNLYIFWDFGNILHPLNMCL